MAQGTAAVQVNLKSEELMGLAHQFLSLAGVTDFPTASVAHRLAVDPDVKELCRWAIHFYSKAQEVR